MQPEHAKVLITLSTKQRSASGSFVLQVLEALVAAADELNTTQATYEYVKQLQVEDATARQGSGAAIGALQTMLTGQLPRDVPHLLVEDLVLVEAGGSAKRPMPPGWRDTAAASISVRSRPPPPTHTPHTHTPHTAPWLPSCPSRPNLRPFHSPLSIHPDVCRTLEDHASRARLGVQTSMYKYVCMGDAGRSTEIFPRGRGVAGRVRRKGMEARILANILLHKRGREKRTYLRRLLYTGGTRDGMRADRPRHVYAGALRRRADRPRHVYAGALRRRAD
eukprot:365053-Chlamydomonas_euryale.AAC.31